MFVNFKIQSIHKKDMFQYYVYRLRNKYYFRQKKNIIIPVMELENIN